MLILVRRNAVIPSGASCKMSVSSIITWPAVGSISRFTHRTKVDLPLPDSPITTKVSAPLMLRFTSSRPTVWPVRSRISSLLTPASTCAITFCGCGPKIL